MRIRRRSEEPSPPGPAAGPVEAVFAAVLDGRRLWLAVVERAGSLGLRGPGGVVNLPVEVLDQTGYLSVRVDLASLPAEAAAYDVVLVGPDATIPVTIASLAPARVPLAPGSRCRHELERTDDGLLVLRTRPVEAALTLVSVTSSPDGPLVEVDGPDGPTTMTTEDLLAPDRPPVRRRDDDLTDPGRGAPLPSDGPVRLRWSKDGLLQVRRVEAGAGDE